MSNLLKLTNVNSKINKIKKGCLKKQPFKY